MSTPEQILKEEQHAKFLVAYECVEQRARELGLFEYAVYTQNVYVQLNDPEITELSWVVGLVPPRGNRQAILNEIKAYQERR